METLNTIARIAIYFLLLAFLIGALSCSYIPPINTQVVTLPCPEDERSE